MVMAVNLRLTNVVKGRVIIASEADLSSVRIIFNDDSTMKVKTIDRPPPRIPKGVQVREVSEHGTEFIIGCEDDTTVDLTLAEPGNSVSVRDRTGEVEYLG
jgi:hypothetical protein